MSIMLERSVLLFVEVNDASSSRACESLSQSFSEIGNGATFYTFFRRAFFNEFAKLDFDTFSSLSDMVHVGSFSFELV